MDEATGNRRIGHVFRPGFLGGERIVWLEGDRLHWRIGGREAEAPLAEIVSMHLMSPQETGRPFARCRIRTAGGRAVWISDGYRFGPGAVLRGPFGGHQRRSVTYDALIAALSRRLRKANPQAVILSGVSRTERIASWVVALAGVVMVLVGAGMMIRMQQVIWPVLAFMAMILAVMPALLPVLRAGPARPVDPERPGHRRGL